MKGLVWALYLMVQDPGASATSWAYTGVTYLNKQSCVSDAATFTKMPIGSKAVGVDPSQTSLTSASSNPNRSTTKASAVLAKATKACLLLECNEAWVVFPAIARSGLLADTA